MQLTTALMWMLLSLCRQTKIGYGIMRGGGHSMQYILEGHGLRMDWFLSQYTSYMCLMMN